MIDEDKKEEQLDEDEIVVELPDEKSEDEAKVKSEEPEDIKAPVVAEETTEPEEETEEESEVEQEEEVEKSEDTEESKDKKVFGKRAEKRIKRLVKEKKGIRSQASRSFFERTSLDSRKRYINISIQRFRITCN